jgi:hypothetical protein
MSGYRKPARILAFTLIFAFWVWAIGYAADAEAHYNPGVHNTRHAINQAWCGRANSYCGASSEAWSVARCETGGTMSVWANNGQYLGLFQMGDYAAAPTDTARTRGGRRGRRTGTTWTRVVTGRRGRASRDR